MATCWRYLFGGIILGLAALNVFAEVRTDGNGRPRIVLSGAAEEAFRSRGGSEIFLSFTHEGGQAVAFVVLERRTDRPGPGLD